MNNWGHENASQRKTYVGIVFDRGEKLVKNEILESLPCEWAKLHTQGYIHIHDLDAYGLTYNCLTFNLFNNFPYEQFEGISETRKIIKLFDYYKEIIVKIGNEQSGGMAFPNFDCDTEFLLTKIGVKPTGINKQLIRDEINSFIEWCNNSHERMGEVSYYVTLNIGLADNELAREICEYVIDEFSCSSARTIKPNIIFKVKGGVNSHKGDRNYYLYEKATLCTAKKMIPTYMLCDCESNKNYDAKKLSIMGCRTRVVADVHGENTAIGRSNIDYITINLPRLAFESDHNIELFKSNWKSVASKVKDILLDRYYKLLKLSKADFTTNTKYSLWYKESNSISNVEEIFKHGTLSIGFIGLSEAIEILTEEKYYETNSGYELAKEIVKHMRAYVDDLRNDYKMNFSLLATSGEFISGRFPTLDKQLYFHTVLDKDFYTNSFHIDVNSKLTAFEKIEKEGFFHNLCNGGCITYVELKSAPIGNSEAIMELLSAAEENGVHYMGINFPLDICNFCGEKGVFDECINCGNKEITRIRRVSGYLEILDYFTEGKKAEVKHRRENQCI